MLPLGRLLRDGLKRFHLEKGVRERKAVSLWEHAAGPAVAAVTQAGTVRDGVLYIITRSSAWSQELSLLREQLMARINDELGAEAITDIRFQVKRLKKPDAPVERTAPERALTHEERATLRALTERLEEDVADRLTRLAARQMRRHAADAACPGCGGPLKVGQTLCPFCRDR